MTKIKCFALGGLDEVGKNCFVIEVDDKIFVFDCGMKILTDVDLGVNSLIPDFKYLIKNKERIQGLFLTSCNVVNAFALKFLLKNIPSLKVFTTVINKKLIIFNKLATIKQAEENINIFKEKTLQFGKNKIHMFHTATNLPGSCGFNLETSSGHIFYTGNMIFESNKDQQIFNTQMSELCRQTKKVLLLISNVSNIEIDGFITPKNKVDSHLKKALMETTRNLYVCCDQNDWYKIYKSIKYINSLKNQEFVFHFFDTNFAKNFKIIMNNFFTNEERQKIISFEKSKNEPNKKHIFFLTGNHKWLFSRIARLITNSKKDPSKSILSKDDCVLIIGENLLNNELAISKSLNNLHQSNAKIQFVSNKKIFLMNNGSEDLKLLINLLQPKYFFPVNAQHKFLLMAKDILVKDNNFLEQNIFVQENGEIITFEDQKWNQKYQYMKVESVFVDNLLNVDIISSVVEERHLLASEGVVLVSFSYQKNQENYFLNSNVDVQTYGLFDKNNNIFLHDEIFKYLKKYLTNLKKNLKRDLLTIIIKKNLSKLIENRTNKKPFVFVIIYNRE